MPALYICRDMKEITIKSFAKVNLSIDVKGLLEGGYHEVEMVMQQVGLYDEVKVSFEEAEENEIKLHTNLPYLPTDERNLAFKAAQFFIQYGVYKIPNTAHGIISIDIKKKVPVAAGLAGGSGNGAAVLHALNYLLDAKLSISELCEIGKDLGSDVPFSIMGQAKANECLSDLFEGDELATSAALAKGRGTELEPIKGLDAYVILVKPPIGVSTKEVYQGIDNCVIERRPDNAELIEALEKKDYRKIYSSMENVLESYTLEHYPIVQEVKDKVKDNTNALKILMSGSGPTVFAIFKDKKSAVASCMKMREMKYECYWARTTK